jgi:hypothetical protein
VEVEQVREDLAPPPRVADQELRELPLRGEDRPGDVS